jgi:hypothetical protein
MQMRLLAPAVAIVASTLAGSASATTTTGTIVQIAANRSNANIVFVHMNPQPTPPVACSTNGNWSYVIPMTTDLDKKIFAMLEAAQLAGRTVTITGTGDCADFGSIESGTIVIVN